MKRGKQDNLFQRGGNWCIDIIVDGQRIRQSFGKDRHVAEIVLHELEKRRTLSRLSANDVEPPKPKKDYLTFEEMCERFIELRSTCKQITLNSYQRIINRNLLPVLGKMRLNQITPEVISRLRGKLLQQKSCRKTIVNKNGKSVKESRLLKPSSVNTILGVLRNILDEAVRIEELDDNPFRKVRGHRVEKRENNPLALEQIQKVILECKPHLQPIITFLAYIGCRPSEAYALKWRQIDFEKEEILIDSARVYGIEGTPKTRAGL